MFIPSSVKRKNKQISKNKVTEKIIKNENIIRSNEISNEKLENKAILNEDNIIKEKQSDSSKNNILKYDIKKNQEIQNNSKNKNLNIQLLRNANIENNVKNEEVKMNYNGEKLKEEEDKVKEYSFQQRWPLYEDEPICIICGRYGEYICDETDHDVCSMECKKIDIQNSKNSIEESSYSTPTNLFNSDKPIEITLGLENITFPIQKILFDSDLLINSINFEDFMKKKPFDIKIPEELEIPNPIQKFESLNLNSQLFQNLKKNRYHKPTLVQMLSIPLLLTGNDMLVKSPTKSGKTLSYLLPLIIHCINMAQCFIDLEDISSNFNSKKKNNIKNKIIILYYIKKNFINLKKKFFFFFFFFFKIELN